MDFDYIRELTREKVEYEAETMLRYRSTFTGNQNMWTLWHMLKELGVFSVNAPGTPEAMALRNYGMKILARVSMAQQMSEFNMIEAALKRGEDLKTPEDVRNMLMRAFNSE